MGVPQKEGRTGMATAAHKTKLIVDIDAQLKKDFKVVCTKEDTPMTSVIEDLIKQYMDKKTKIE